ncbi:hypothetical protein [Novosphingobium album (ex Liu et al. 2023)]|uniref:Uncharacterized protein n=1 Tax=Novosphingobium album (ex Liu et al. 2023) TaxID=3031130 RepID=A0ABT5WM17_9SPHN|nr:hypothetical protein [Novosphingobium album (ex Liu et al. 2023)]MDE8650924.1 hypothetical protein [Novosphingobium album (ex Liu et al. 2023)]
MPSPDIGAIRAEERARIIALLARYPGLDPAELDELKTWFSRAASALDVGLVASEPQVAEQYRRFRAEHIDRFSRRDLRTACAMVAAIGLMVIAVASQMP